jgi:uncharacterized membrane-anchored protein YhcB (DUF1043 family)
VWQYPSISLTFVICVGRILNRLNQPDTDGQDLEELKTEMEELVGQAEQIEANLEGIENMEAEVKIVVDDCEESDDDMSLDDEVRMITSDLQKGEKGAA